MSQQKHDCVSRNMTLQVDLRHDRPLITWASDWDAVRTVGHSFRSTTSSTTPGHKNEGTVAYALNKIVTCPDCGGLRYAGTGPHAPRWLDRRRVDCCLREVRP